MNRDDELYESKEQASRGLRLEQVLRVYSWFGLLIALFSGVYFLFTFLHFELSPNQRFSLMMAGTGIALALMSRTLIILRKERAAAEFEKMKQNENILMFLDSWSKFEKVSKRALAKEKAREGFSKHSLRSIISQLHKEGKLSSRDLITLEEALQTRNSIVHGERSLPPSLVVRVLNSVVEITEKITSS